MDCVERVKRAITFQKPDRVPILYFNQNKDKSDIVMIDIQNHFSGENKDISEWGFKWERLDDTMGQPIEELVKDWKDFEKLHIPAINLVDRINWINKQKNQCLKNQYLLGSLQLSGFTTMTFLRGFAQVMEDFYLEPEEIAKLADMVFDYEIKLIEIAAQTGLHGIAFFDDWGTQSGMFISPKLWNEFFKPRYKKQFDIAHEYGLDVYFHSCGKIDPIIGEFLEIGVDMMNLSQPNLFDMKQLSHEFGGKGCFVIPVSYQTTSISGTREDIFRDVNIAVDCLGSCEGGLIGYIEEYSSMGMSQENYQNCIDAFLELGKYS